MNIGFIMHPLVIKDLYVYKPYLKWLPSFIIKKKMLKKEPTVVATTTYGTHTIHLIGIPLTCDMFKTYDRSLIEKKLLACIKVAKQYNITLLGVGAYAAIYSKQGALLSGHGIGITSGKALTIGSVMQQAKRYMKKSSVIGVVGAQGAIGKKITELSSQYNIISITRHNMQDISQCDDIISATSDAGLIIDESLLKKNAVVIDAARPYDITRQP
ncbi:MAG: hypothetical protein ACMXYC_04645, partial [Candidatus Woesearchaeota archaeon]